VPTINEESVLVVGLFMFRGDTKLRIPKSP
jgi:hypothetical protein